MKRNKRRARKPVATPTATKRLIAACIRGDEAAWREFIRIYNPVIKASINHTLRQGEKRYDIEVDDIVQDVYLRLLKNNQRPLRNFDPTRAGLSTYLSQIARSTIFDALKHPQLPTEPLRDHSQLQQPKPTAADLPELPLHVLSHRERQVMEMVLSEGWSSRKIGEELGISAANVRMAKSRAVRKLCKRIQQEEHL